MCLVSLVRACVCVCTRMCVCACMCAYMCACVCACVCGVCVGVTILPVSVTLSLNYLFSQSFKVKPLGKRYVPEKEYIHMISSYITADWSNIE